MEIKEVAAIAMTVNASRTRALFDARAMNRTPASGVQPLEPVPPDPEPGST